MPVGQIPNETIQFVRAIDEIGIINDLAEDLGIFVGCHYALWRNANWRNVQVRAKTGAQCPARTPQKLHGSINVE